MRILIDECVDPRVKLLFGDHERATVHDKGWDTLEDGPLLALAQKEFDALVTIDSRMEFQQNIPKFQIGLSSSTFPRTSLLTTACSRKNWLRQWRTFNRAR
jgi:hypothetical protein